MLDTYIQLVAVAVCLKLKRDPDELIRVGAVVMKRHEYYAVVLQHELASSPSETPSGRLASSAV